jgi:hypothetical protein
VLESTFCSPARGFLFSCRWQVHRSRPNLRSPRQISIAPVRLPTPILRLAGDDQRRKPVVRLPPGSPNASTAFAPLRGFLPSGSQRLPLPHPEAHPAIRPISLRSPSTDNRNHPLTAHRSRSATSRPAHCSVSVSLSVSRPSGLLVLRALLRPWSLRSPGPWRVVRHRAVMPFQALSHPLLGFHSPTGFHRRSPQRRERSRDRSFVSTLSLSWGFVPYSDRQLEGSESRWPHPPARCVFRVQTSLDALLPFEPSSHF